MERRLAAVGSLAALLVAAPAAAAAPNQGDASKVITADNPLVSCDAVPTKKVENVKGRTLHLSSEIPIDYVTIKSGQNAKVVSTDFDSALSGTVKLSKDVSNYVVWVCPDGGGGGDPTIIT
jgi:hypothetical protein